MITFSSAPALETPAHPVGRRTLELIDTARNARSLTVDIWYPAVLADEPRARYEVLPGVAFDAAVARDQPVVAGGRYPLILLSHGRTGMRFAYSLLCEALAARGNIVVSADHPGDALMDWLSGTFVDDRTNEMGRVGDARFLLDALLTAERSSTIVPSDLLDAIDTERVVAIGHSYGAYTALATAAGARGVPADTRLRAVIGLQPFTRTMSDNALARVTVPTLLVISEHDTTTPAAIDGDRPWLLVGGNPVWRMDLGSASHHASSDMGLYLELAGQIPDLPPMVTAYVAMMAPDMIGSHIRPWREGLVLVVGAIGAFLDVALGIDSPRGLAEADHLAATADVTLRRRAAVSR